MLIVMMLINVIVFIPISVALLIYAFGMENKGFLFYVAVAVALYLLWMTIDWFRKVVPVLVSRDKRKIEFKVETDVLERIETEEVYIKNGRTSFPIEKKVMIFEKYGRYTARPEDRSALQYSSIGDTFYLVLTGAGSINYVYNAKIYEYVDNG